MILPYTTRSSLALLVLTVSLSAQSANPIFWHFEDLYNYDGSETIADLKGHPVVVVVAKKSAEAMKVSSQLASKYAKKGLVVILWTEETVATPTLEYARLLRINPKSLVWLCASASPPLDLKVSASPRLTWISVSGLPLHRNLEIGKREKVEKAIRRQLDLRKKGWGNHTIAVGIRARAFGGSALSKAYFYLLAVGSRVPKEVTDSAHDMNDLFAHRIRQLRWLDREGRYKDVRAACKTLTKSVRGRKKWEDEVAKNEAEFMAKYKKAAIKQEKKLLRLIKPLAKAKATQKVVDSLTAFIASSEDPFLSRRATRCLELSKAFMAIDQANADK